MEQSYVYVDDENEEGLTFKKVGHFLKKGWLRMLIYAAVLVAVSMIVVLPIKFFYKTDHVAKTTVEFVYDGIERGQDPNGGLLNTDNIISTAVLSDAVEAAGLTEVITQIAPLYASLRVEGVPTEEYLKLVQDAADGNVEAQTALRTYKMYPTQFNIKIIEPKKLGLSDEQARVLLDRIVVSYYNDFQTRFVNFKPFSTQDYNKSDDPIYEFTGIYDDYTNLLTPIVNYIEELRTNETTQASSKFDIEFSRLVASINNIIANDYNQFNSYVVTKNIWVNKTLAKATLNENIDRLTYEISNLQEHIDSLKKQIADYTPNSTTTTSPEGGQTVSTSYGAEYEKLQVELSNKNNLILSKKNELSSMEKRLSKISGEDATDEATIAATRLRLKELEAKTVALIDDVNSTLSRYNSTVLANSVRQIQPATVTRASLDFNVVIVFLCVALAGLLAGGIVTGVKIARANAAAKNAAVSENKTAADQSAAADTSEKEKNDNVKKE